MTKKLSGIFLLIVLFFGCQPEKEVKEVDYSQMQESLLESNKNAAKLENEQIEQYIKRRQWGVVSTGTGLRYFVYQNGTGVQAKEGNVVSVFFTISLLNGKICYTNVGTDKPEQFIVGHDDVESGLHEGIQHLKVGDKAMLIIPSHLAHGLVGDLNKIPPQSTIVYDIELVAVR